MAPFDIEAFLVWPCYEQLDRCKKDDLMEIARHFSLVVSQTIRDPSASYETLEAHTLPIRGIVLLMGNDIAGGCNANIFYADAPKPQIELLTEAFHDYVATAKETADDTLQMIDHSQFGKHVFNLLISRYMAAFYFASAVHEQLPPATKDMIHKVNRESWRLERELAAVLETYTNNMEAQIQQRVEQLKQELAPYAESLDTEALRAALEQKSEKLRQSVKDLQVQLGPYTDYLKLKVDQHLQDFQERMAPVTEKVHRQLIQRANQVQKMAAPYVEDLKVKLDPYAQVLQARLTSLYEAYAKST
ncbi:apolipoprotein A-I-like [Pseudochaenichthys georgianus]|uniref:apolipoprotein A-I-like n=1 Tax=Pseudochaenichthys georgianus TaxID=52239 RepID=UPI0039C00D51